jgi:hypothetical protein
MFLVTRVYKIKDKSPFLRKCYYIYGISRKELFMKKKKKPRIMPMPPTDGSIKLSKYALWCLKNPEGIDMIIHDMRAVMR